MRASDFSGVIFCEDIRREITEKLILIGVYTGEVVSDFSCPYSISHLGRN
jgi:hypothetical protein